MNRAQFERLAHHYGPSAIIETLRPYLSERRQQRIEQVLDARLRSVEVAIENPYDPHNAAAIVRSAEALGAWSVHVIAASQKILRAGGTTMGTHNWIETVNHATLEPFLADVRARGISLAGACVEATHMLDELPCDRPICLLFGNEHAGLSAAARDACELRFRIPIYGFAESYNMSVAAALSLYSLTGRRRAALGRLGDLDAETRELERAAWYYRSVDQRHAQTLFPPSADASRPASR